VLVVTSLICLRVVTYTEWVWSTLKPPHWSEPFYHPVTPGWSIPSAIAIGICGTLGCLAAIRLCRSWVVSRAGFRRSLTCC